VGATQKQDPSPYKANRDKKLGRTQTGIFLHETDTL
jgi:hypothetical protein